MSPVILRIPEASGGLHDVLVDEADLAAVGRWTWCVVSARTASRRTFYVRGGPEKALHRMLLSAPFGLEVDHIDGNGLNNQRSNLRLCTHAQNQHNKGPSSRNKTGFKGVSFDNYHGRFAAKIKLNGKQRHIGYFDSAVEAAQAYALEAKRLHGSFANTGW